MRNRRAQAIAGVVRRLRKLEHAAARGALLAREMLTLVDKKNTEAVSFLAVLGSQVIVECDAYSKARIVMQALARDLSGIGHSPWQESMLEGMACKQAQEDAIEGLAKQGWDEEV